MDHVFAQQKRTEECSTSLVGKQEAKEYKPHQNEAAVNFIIKFKAVRRSEFFITTYWCHET